MASETVPTGLQQEITFQRSSCRRHWNCFFI